MGRGGARSAIVTGGARGIGRGCALALAAAGYDIAPVAPLWSAFTTHRRAVLACFGLTMAWTAASYVYITFMPTFAAQSLGLAPRDAQAGVVFASLTNIVVVPLAGLMADRWGRGPMVVSAAGFALLSIPLFLMLVSLQSFAGLVAVAVVAGGLLGLYNGAAPHALCALFPTSVRYTALSVGYNGAVMIFGGFAPFISTLLVRESGLAIAPSFYVTACAVATLGVLLAMRRKELLA
ncbi:MFS transporter [Phenylobacterium sp.]|uniref:MFS transporter n=1 Tax=Phenylobacterium sp. TaxID=1871053 RepID=UPI00391B6F74